MTNESSLNKNVTCMRQSIKSLRQVENTETNEEKLNVESEEKNRFDKEIFLNFLSRSN